MPTGMTGRPWPRSTIRIALLLQVNPAREKKLTNVRNTGSEERVALAPPRQLTLEDAIGGYCLYALHGTNASQYVHCISQAA